MKYCKRCVMPDTRPGIYFKDGVCGPCLNAEKKRSINWKARWKELIDLCDKYRRHDIYYDCIIPVSGGKDSHYQTYIMKECLGMNPLLLMVDNYSWTETGRHNIENLVETFGCDLITLTLNRRVAKIMTRIAFREWGSPTWSWDRAVYTWPLQMALNLKIPLIVYGENTSYEYGGPLKEENYSAQNQIHNNAVIPIEWDTWLQLAPELSMKDFNPLIYPVNSNIEYLDSFIEPIYLSYFMPWDGRKNMEIAKRYGFRTLCHEWNREGFIEDYDQIDAPGYLVHPWMKYPKYGHARATDVACYWIRNGYISRDEGIELVRKYDHKLDQKAVADFLDFTGFSHVEFWNIVDKFYNREIFEQIDGQWRLKEPIWWQQYVLCDNKE